MKKKILLIIMMIFTLACSKKSSDFSQPSEGLSGASGYVPVVGSKPYDAEETRTYNISLSNLSGHSVYAVATNQLVYHNRDTQLIFSGNKISSLSENVVEDSRKILDFQPNFDYEHNELSVSSSDVSKSLQLAISYAEGSTRDYKVYKMTTSSQDLTTISATLQRRKSVGNRTVNIWVEDSVWSGNSYIKNKINYTMVETLANKFLTNGTTDIYGQVTGIFGREYYDGTPKYSELIYGSGEIDVVLFNIHDSYSNGRVLGYFNPMDMFVKDTGKARNSNERAAFYLDAYSLADSGDISWDVDDFWVEATISTLAHEFTHLVTFYQHYVLRGGNMATWLSELLAMVTEDIVSNKVGLKGPRGIIGTNLSSGVPNIGVGRLSLANIYNNFPINDYYMASSINYAVVYSYGAYLIRNFGVESNGLEFVRDIMWSGLNDFDAVEDSLKKHGFDYSFIDTLALWGKASVLSNEIFTSSEKYKYDNGSNGFATSIGGVDYRLGSINLYNYAYKPTMYGLSDSSVPLLGKGSVLLFNLGNDITGSFSTNIDLPNYTRLEILVVDKDGNYLPTRLAKVVEVR